MEEIRFKYIKFIPFNLFDLWDSKRYTSNAIKSGFQIVILGDCIIEENKKYKLFEEENKEFGILGVNNKDGIFDAYTQKGKDINQPYKKMKVGWLAYNPYRINVGSIGIRLKNHLNEYISPAYVVFSCKNDLLPEFLFLIFKTSIFNKIINESTTGSVRQNLTFDTLRKLKIPLPSITEQQRIVDAYYQKIEQAKELEEEVGNLEKSIEEYLFETLEIGEINNINRHQLLHFVDFKNTNRWDSLYLLGKIPSLKSKYKLIKFSEIIKYFNTDKNNKSIRIDSCKFPEVKFRYIGMEHIEKDSGNLLEMPLVNGKEIKSQTIRVPKDYLIFGKLRPYLNKYWINNFDFDNIICSSEFFVFDIDIKVNKLFFKYVLASKIIQSQISDKTSGARMPRINESIFFNLQIPLPPKHIQDEIEVSISRIKNQIKAIRNKAEELKAKAEGEFEEEIFGGK